MTGLRARDKIHFFFLNLSRDRDERDNSSPQLEKVKKKNIGLLILLEMFSILHSDVNTSKSSLVGFGLVCAFSA